MSENREYFLKTPIDPLGFPGSIGKILAENEIT